MKMASMLVSGLVVAGVLSANAETVSIYNVPGEMVSQGNSAAAIWNGAPADDAVTIDIWTGGPDIYDWGINTTYYWATAFDTEDITETHDVTEVRWYASGTGVDEEYWIAPDAGGSPDTGNSTYLGFQTVPSGGWEWKSFDCSAAGATVEPGQIYWFIRALKPLGGFDLTWRSTTNANPPLQNPVQISQNFGFGWQPWVTGLNWHMEYEILGETGGPPVICFDFDPYCDGLELGKSGKNIFGYWRNTDCAGTDVEVVGRIVGNEGRVKGDVGGYTWGFLIDGLPLDGTLDMYQQSGGWNLWIDELMYNDYNGPCLFDESSSISSTMVK